MRIVLIFVQVYGGAGKRVELGGLGVGVGAGRDGRGGRLSRPDRGQRRSRSTHFVHGNGQRSLMQWTCQIERDLTADHERRRRGFFNRDAAIIK